MNDSYNTNEDPPGCLLIIGLIIGTLVILGGILLLYWPR